MEGRLKAAFRRRTGHKQNTKKKNHKMNTKKIIGYIGLALLAALAVGLWTLDFGLWTSAAGLALAAAPLALTEEQIKEFQGILGEIKGGWSEMKNLPVTFKSLQDENTRLQQHMTDVRRLMASRHSTPGVRRPGLVSDECARHLAAQFVVHCEKSDKLEALCSLGSQRDALMNFARNALNISTRSA